MRKQDRDFGYIHPTQRRPTRNELLAKTDEIDIMRPRETANSKVVENRWESGPIDKRHWRMIILLKWYKMWRWCTLSSLWMAALLICIPIETSCNAMLGARRSKLTQPVDVGKREGSNVARAPRRSCTDSWTSQRFWISHAHHSHIITETRAEVSFRLLSLCRDTVKGRKYFLVTWVKKIPRDRDCASTVIYPFQHSCDSKSAWTLTYKSNRQIITGHYSWSYMMLLGYGRRRISVFPSVNFPNANQHSRHFIR